MTTFNQLRFFSVREAAIGAINCGVRLIYKQSCEQYNSKQSCEQYQSKQYCKQHTKEQYCKQHKNKYCLSTMPNLPTIARYNVEIFVPFSCPHV